MGQPDRISEFLLDLWRNQERCIDLADDLKPVDVAEAYRIQARIEKQSKQALAGWKIAATSAAGQKHIGVSGPLAGRYIAERVVASGGRIPFGRNHMKVAEIEFAFRMGADLAPRATPYSEEEVFGAVESLHPAIEIPDSRYEHFSKVGAPALIADNACADWMAIGEAAPELWRAMDLASFEPIGRITGKGEWKGVGRNVLGSPQIAMTWIANTLSGLGITLAKGQFVTTGTCLVPLAIGAHDRIEGDFGPLGRVSVTITE